MQTHTTPFRKSNPRYFVYDKIKEILDDHNVKYMVRTSEHFIEIYINGSAMFFVYDDMFYIDAGASSLRFVSQHEEELIHEMVNFIGLLLGCD